MTAVMLVRGTDPELFQWFVVVSLVASGLALFLSGIGPFLQWAGRGSAWRRRAIATVIGMLLLAAVVWADPLMAARLANPYPIDCDIWINWPICWIFWG